MHRICNLKLWNGFWQRFLRASRRFIYFRLRIQPELNGMFTNWTTCVWIDDDRMNCKRVSMTRLSCGYITRSSASPVQTSSLSINGIDRLQQKNMIENMRARMRPHNIAYRESIITTQVLERTERKNNIFFIRAMFRTRFGQMHPTHHHHLRNNNLMIECEPRNECDDRRRWPNWVVYVERFMINLSLERSEWEMSARAGTMACASAIAIRIDDTDCSRLLKCVLPPK